MVFVSLTICDYVSAMFMQFRFQLPDGALKIVCFSTAKSAELKRQLRFGLDRILKFLLSFFVFFYYLLISSSFFFWKSGSTHFWADCYCPRKIGIQRKSRPIVFSFFSYSFSISRHLFLFFFLLFFFLHSFSPHFFSGSCCSFEPE